MKHLWLEKAGIHHYPDNHWGGVRSLKDLRSVLRAKREKRRTGVDPRDCWELEDSFYLWLYEHLCQLVNDTNADLTWQKFQHNEKEYTEGEYIEYLKSLLLNMINFDEFKDCPDLPHEFEKNEDELGYTYTCTASDEQRQEFMDVYTKNGEEYNKLRKEICDVFYELLPSLWW